MAWLVHDTGANNRYCPLKQTAQLNFDSWCHQRLSMVKQRPWNLLYKQCNAAD